MIKLDCMLVLDQRQRKGRRGGRDKHSAPPPTDTPQSNMTRGNRKARETGDKTQDTSQNLEGAMCSGLILLAVFEHRCAALGVHGLFRVVPTSLRPELASARLLSREAPREEVH
jgi:hypothetical protein